MAMSIQGDDDSGMMAQINTTPLVDVMLVLLIIFLVTIPVLVSSVPLELPKASNIPTETTPQNITIAIDKTGRIYWNDLLMPNNDVLLERIKKVAVMQPQPEIHVRADKEVRYEFVGRVIVLTQRGGILKVGFITEPAHAAAGAQ